MAFSWRSLLPIAGGALGSFIPGVGTAIGGAIGSAAGGLLGSALSPRSSATPQNPQLMNNQSMGQYNTQELPGGTTAVQMPNFTPQQQQALSQLLQQSLGGLQNLPQADFNKIRQAETSNFYQNIVPGIAERFTGAGAGGQRSSAFAQSLGSAGAGLSERLAAMEQGFNMQNKGLDQQRLLALLQAGLSPQYQYQFVEPKQSPFAGLLGGLAQGVGSIGTALGANYLTNKLG